MKSFLFAQAAALCLIAFGASADEPWNNLNLRAANGTEITVDYQFNPRCQRATYEGRSDASIRYADPVWFNVKGIPPGRNVRLNLEFYSKSNRRTGSLDNPIVRDYRHYDREMALWYAGENRYTLGIYQMPVRLTVGSSYTDLAIIQRIRITIDGQPLIDPINGTDRFQLNLDNKIGCRSF
ncbi:MAG TPA: hypothetical protein VFV50_09390 [Bdellovibrionales bacterium]|nr:hypothetical protein [Bdellovibrionales bacterium]